MYNRITFAHLYLQLTGGKRRRNIEKKNDSIEMLRLRHHRASQQIVKMYRELINAGTLMFASMQD